LQVAGYGFLRGKVDCISGMNSPSESTNSIAGQSAALEWLVYGEKNMSGLYRDLKVWQAAMQLVFDVYDTTRNFPHGELYGLVSQMRRAAVSIPSNIAEGKGRSTHKDFAAFLRHSRGSLHELETQVMIAEHLGYVSPKQSSDLLSRARDVGRMLNGLSGYATAA
jgi:four helix bundle protein